MGGALRVSQTQLLQPFFSILAAVPLLGEPLTLWLIGGLVLVSGGAYLAARPLRQHPLKTPC